MTRADVIRECAAICDSRADSLEEQGFPVLAAEARKCALAIRGKLPKGQKATWRKVGIRAEAELRDRDGALVQAFLRVGPVWYTRTSEAAEWERCAPAIVPVQVADLLREAA